MWGPGAEFAGPELVTQHGGQGRARPVVRAAEHAAEQRLRAGQAEETAGDRRRAGQRSLAMSGQRKMRGVHAGHLFEAMVLAAPVLVIYPSHADALGLGVPFA